MKKNLLALSVAAIVGSLSAAANAGVVPGTGAAGNFADATLATPTATALRFTPDGIGHILLVPYYTVQAGNATLLNITNTDTVNGKAVKVRFRGALNSDDVFDFQVLMSPGDVWTATITQGADGRAQLVTADNTCTLPASVNQSFVTDRLPGDAATKAAGTREGYIEIFNMADIPPIIAAGATESMYEAIKHSSTGAVTCTASVLAPLATNITTEAAATTQGFESPSTGLMANWTIVNVPEASSWAGSAAAIVAETVAGAPGVGNFVFHPQTDGPVAITNANSADPLLRAQKVGGAFFDLPDLSTPYLAGLLNADTQAIALTQALAVQSVTNEYVTDPSIAAQTSWVFSMPTRRYAVGVNYAGTVAAKDRLVFNEQIHNGGGYAVDAFFAAPALTGLNEAGVANTGSSETNIALTGDAACVRLNAGAVSAFNRSEAGLAGTGFVISPGSATVLEFCGETTVIGFNQTSALGASIATKDVDVGTFVDGWARIATPGLTNNGLPVLGQSFLKATNPGVAAGVSGNFGASWDHRYVR